MSPISITIIISALVLVVVSGAAQQKTLDRWTQETGRAPMVNRGRGRWYRYLRSVKVEMPQSVRRRIAAWNWAGNVSIAVAFVVFLIHTARHHR